MKYRLVERTTRGDKLILETNNIREAQREYSRRRDMDAWTRLIMNGQDVPILEADKKLYRNTNRSRGGRNKAGRRRTEGGSA